MRELDCFELYRDAAFYDEEFAEREFEIPFYRRLANRCGGPILEVACGTGRLTIPLAMGGHQIAALDVSEPMLRLAKQKAQIEGVPTTPISSRVEQYNVDPWSCFDPVVIHLRSHSPLLLNA